MEASSNLLIEKLDIFLSLIDILNSITGLLQQLWSKVLVWNWPQVINSFLSSIRPWVNAHIAAFGIWNPAKYNVFYLVHNPEKWSPGELFKCVWKQHWV